MSRDQRKYKEADKQRRAGEREKRRLEKQQKELLDDSGGRVFLDEESFLASLQETTTDGKEEE